MYYPYKDIILARKILKALSGNKKYHPIDEIAESISHTRNSYGHKRVRYSLERLADQGYCEEYTVLSGKIKKGNSRNNKILYDTKRYHKHVSIIEKSEGWQKRISKKGHIPSQLIHTAINLSIEKFVRLEPDEEFKKIKARYWSLTTKGAFAVIPIIKKEEFRLFVTRNEENSVEFKMISILLSTSNKIHVDTLIKKLDDIKKDDATDIEEIVDEWYAKMKTYVKEFSISKNTNPLLKKFQNQLKHDDMISRNRTRKR